MKVPHSSATYKTSEEYEFSGSLDDALRALALLGFSEYAWNEKHRVSYRFGAVRIDIDGYLDHTSVPAFLEIEGEADAIEAAIELLELTDHDRGRAVSSSIATGASERAGGRGRSRAVRR